VKTASNTDAITSPSGGGGARPQGSQLAERRRVAELIDSRRDEIQRRWREDAARELGAEERPGQDRHQVEAALGDYLSELARALRGEGPLAVSGSAAWRTVSDRHGLTLPAPGFDLHHLVTQLVLLRRALVAVVRRPPGDPQPSEPAVDIVDQVIDAAVVQVASHYVHHRDYQARQVRAEYIGFVTHELRNPLTTAMVAGSRLQGGASPGDETRAVELLQRNLKRVARLIDDFLTSEQIGAEAIRMHPVDTLVGEIMDAAVEPALRAAQKPEVHLSVSVDPGLVVRVDPPLTVAAVQNVLINAVQFSDRNLVKIDAEDTPDRVILHVRDHCRGLPPGEVAALFDPFHGAHPGKPIPGLGLSVARRILQEQGGTIHAGSDAEGCHFRIELPKPHLPPARKATGEERGPDTHS
jgi:signal transduction histidine kinase